MKLVGISFDHDSRKSSVHQQMVRGTKLKIVAVKGQVGVGTFETIDAHSKRLRGWSVRLVVKSIDGLTNT